VLKNKGDKDYRDPKVFFHAATKRWIMPLAVGDHLELFSSGNLKEWIKESEFGKLQGSHGGTWECPDLFHYTQKTEQKSGYSSKIWTGEVSMEDLEPVFYWSIRWQGFNQRPFTR